MDDDLDHVDVRTARLAATAGAVVWILIASLLRGTLGTLVMVAVSLIGLPLTALWAITVVEAARRRLRVA
jgi:hypothetical protein